MTDYIVEMRNITKKFPGITANDDVTIGIKKGEIIALLGENGAGKSTLMSMLFGMYDPDNGEIFVRGKKVRISSPSHAASLGIGMVHQHFKLVSNYSITQNIILGVEPKKRLLGFLPSVDIARAESDVAELSKRYGLEVDPRAKIENINVSTQQRVEILKMLYRNADILIFDEPTAMLTPQEVDFLLDIIRELRAGGKTVILITHKLEEIKKVADRCAILCRGKLVDVLDVADTPTQAMANLMVGREVSFTTNKNPANFGNEVLRVEGLCVKDVHGGAAVENVSFSIRAGEIFAIAGVSGNGQIEIADAIAGLTKASSGKVLLNGRDITGDSVRKRTMDGISYIPEDRQSFGLVLDFTLAENLALKKYHHSPFSSRFGFLNRESFCENGTALVNKFDIRSGQGIGTVVRSMSGGNQQKAIVAREIDLASPLMIFVQPTRGLDIGAIENIHADILAERDKGHAVLLVSLELDEVMNLADTIGVVYNGKLVKIAAADELDSNTVGEYMMGVSGK